MKGTRRWRRTLIILGILVLLATIAAVVLVFVPAEWLGVAHFGHPWPGSRH